MREPHSPFRDGNFLTSFRTSIRWVPRKDGSRRVELAEICRLKRYTAAEARTCLASTHVAMIGDSMTWYLYLSLAHFVERGTFPPRFNGPAASRRKDDATTTTPSSCTHFDETGHETCSPPDKPNVCVIDDWKDSVPPEYENDGWRHLTSSVGGGPTAGDGGIVQGRMESSAVKTAQLKPGHHVENVLYANGETGTTLSYVFEGGWGDPPSPLQGFWLTNCLSSGTCRVPPEEFDRRLKRAAAADVDWRQTFPEAIQKGGAVRALLPKPDVAICTAADCGGCSTNRAPGRSCRACTTVWAGKIPVGASSYLPRPTTGRCFFRSSTANDRSLHPTHDYFRYEFQHVRASRILSGLLVH
jgi:hypothetical protein